MVYHITWVKRYKGKKALVDLSNSFYGITNTLGNLGLLMEYEGFEYDFEEKLTGDDGACADFLLANYMPLAKVSVSAKKNFGSSSGEIFLNVMHFFGPDYKFGNKDRFSELEVIAMKHGLKLRKGMS